MAIEMNAVVVETIQQSACRGCAAQKGCGQSVLSRFLSKSTLVRVVVQQQDIVGLAVGDAVTIGIAENTVTRSTAVAYCMPLLLMLVSVVGVSFFSRGDGAILVSAMAGLLVGGVFAYIYGCRHKFDPAMQPVLVSGSTDQQIASKLIVCE